MTDLFKNLNDAASVWRGDWPLEALQADWQPIVRSFLESAQGQSLQRFLQGRLQAKARIYPPRPLRALELTARSAVRVLILGQDPYHGQGQAEGLAFSVQPGVKIPPSLRNIFKERQRDLKIAPPASGSLLAWAEQGVLLLNTTLTVEDGQPASHARSGWEHLSDAILLACAQKPEPVAFLLWGSHAQAKRHWIDQHNADGRHLVLTANHPSPLSALRPPQPFIGCGHFGRILRWSQNAGYSANRLFH